MAWALRRPLGIPALHRTHLGYPGAKSFKKKSVINHFNQINQTLLATFTNGETDGFWIHRQIEGAPVRKLHLNSVKFHFKEEMKKKMKLRCGIISLTTSMLT